MMPITCTVFPVSAISGVLITKYGRFRWAIWAGWVVIMLSTGLLLLLNTSIKTYAWVLVFALVGFGHGLNLTALSVCIQASADSSDVGYAAAMYTFMRSFGMCVGVPVGGTVFQNRLNHHLHALNLSTQIAKDAEGYIVQLKTLPMSSTLRQALNLAYAWSFQDIFKVLMGVAALGAFTSLSIRHVILDRRLESDHIFVESKGGK